MTAPVSIPDTVFEHAISISDPAERASYLDRACGADRALRRDAERLVQDHFQAGSFLERPGLVLDITTPPPAVEQIGAMIGPYKLLEQIGEGGMGLVYMAEQQRPVKRLIALKIIKPGMDTKQVIARFEAERQALAMMDHPNIAKILDAGVSSRHTPCAVAEDDGTRSVPTTEVGRPYFVMELVRGLPINEFCDHKRLSIPERLKLFIQVCQAVQHAHQKGIIHRDLKPTNVLVTMADTVPVPKVIDFGIAKALGPSLTDHTLHTGFAQMIGTPLYMSPEQAELNQFGVDTRSDVYSLGVMLYELLTGTTPFDKETLTKVGFDEMRRIIREEVPETVSARIARTKSSRHTPCAVPSSLATSHQPLAPRLSELDWIVARALEKDRSRRYESPSALAADIQRYLADEPVQACPPSTLYRFHKFARKNKAAFTTVALFATSLLLGTTVSIWQAIRATAAEAQATANKVKANAEEEKATALAQSEAQQRKQAEKALESALAAVGRILANVTDEELNEFPRIGVLRRRQLKDAVEFVQRIPISPRESPAIRFQLAQTWHKVAELQWELDEPEQAIKSYQTSIDTLCSLAAEQPKESRYRVFLASVHGRAGCAYIQGLHSYSAAENSFRRSIELYAQLSREEPTKDSWVIHQCRQLHGLSSAVMLLNRPAEAQRHESRALELIESVKDPDQFERAAFLEQLARLKFDDAPNESRTLYRQAIDSYKAHLARHNVGAEQQRVAPQLEVIAGHLQQRFPDDAEKYWDESIELWRKVCGPTPRIRLTAELFVRSLANQSRHLRNRAKQESPTNSSAIASDRLRKAELLYQEALTHQRNNVSRFQLVNDRFQLVTMLQGQARYLLDNLPKAVTAAASASGDSPQRQPEPRSPSPTELQADALLTEAIQLCRALAAEFPDNADYKSCLATLVKLQAQHFGQPSAAEHSK